MSAHEQNERNLASVELLRGISNEDRRALEAQCRWRRYRVGERVFERGSHGRDVFFVIEGAVSIVNYSPLGREVSFATASKGDIFGEMAAIDEQPRSASVVAAEDALVAVVSSEAFLDLLSRQGTLTLRLLRRIVGFLRQSGERVLELTGVDAAARICANLLRLAKPDPAAADLLAIKPLPPLRQLASEAGTTREHVTNTLNRLYAEGHIRRRGGSLYIVNRTGLQELAQGSGQAA
jgi:CRP/FNR family transcriptional regulator, cyclic AMP receptor protein